MVHSDASNNLVSQESFTDVLFVMVIDIVKEEVQQVYCCLLSFYFHFGRKFDYFVEYWSGRLSLPFLC